VATVTRISIAPVKGLGLVHPDAVDLERTGVLANRRFHVVDAAGRRYNQLRNGALVQIRPAYGPEREHLALSFPDGTDAAGTVELGEAITTDFYGRRVVGRVVEGPWSEALSRWAGRPLRLVQSEPGAAIDRARGHVSLISSASLHALAREGGRDAVDGRRFRMLFEIDGLDAHGEDEWIGRRLRIGDALVHLRGDVARCAITTQNPDTGVPDFDTLRTIAGYRRVMLNRNGTKQIPFGVFGNVLEPGRVSAGDKLEPIELSLLDAAG
jgi:MOSC domain-containing protein